MVRLDVAAPLEHLSDLKDRKATHGSYPFGQTWALFGTTLLLRLPFCFCLSSDCCCWAMQIQKPNRPTDRQTERRRAELRLVRGCWAAGVLGYWGRECAHLTNTIFEIERQTFEQSTLSVGNGNETQCAAVSVKASASCWRICWVCWFVDSFRLIAPPPSESASSQVAHQPAANYWRLTADGRQTNLSSLRIIPAMERPMPGLDRTGPVCTQMCLSCARTCVWKFGSAYIGLSLFHSVHEWKCVENLLTLFN